LCRCEREYASEKLLRRRKKSQIVENTSVIIIIAVSSLHLRPLSLAHAAQTGATDCQP
jgi:hypothetical protein